MSAFILVLQLTMAGDAADSKLRSGNSTLQGPALVSIFADSDWLKELASPEGVSVRYESNAEGRWSH